MIGLIATLVGEKLARPVFFGLLAILALIVLSIGYCSLHRSDDSAAKQAEQTSRSGEAISNAAGIAIETIGNRTATDDTIDAATENATKSIDNAQSVDDVRAAVLAGVCGQPSHRDDPACK